MAEMYSYNYEGAEREEELVEYGHPVPDGIYLEDDDDFHNHDVGPAPQPPRFGDL